MPVMGGLSAAVVDVLARLVLRFLVWLWRGLMSRVEAWNLMSYIPTSWTPYRVRNTGETGE
jgi:hypothetical protein